MSQFRKIIHEDYTPKYIVLSGGLLAGISEIITTYPLDTIKTHLQVYPNKYRNSIHCGKHIFINYGPRSFFNGMSASLAQVGGKAAIRFTTYDYIKQSLSKSYPKSNFISLFSGMAAGTIESIIWTAPTERIKILQQKNPHKIIPTKIIVKNIIKTKGLLNMYQGTFPTILKQSTSVGSRFWMYEFLKSRCIKNNESVGFIKTIFIGGFAGGFSAAINQPFDTIKSIIQANENKPNGIYKTGRFLIKNYGFAGLFNGLNARILRVGIAQAITFTVYETYISIMNSNTMT